MGASLPQRKFAVFVFACCLFAGGGGAAPLSAQTPPPAAAQLLEQGLELHRAGDLAGAIGKYQAALAIAPAHIVALTNLGAALAQSGRYEEAIASYRRALALDDTRPEIHYNLALALYKAALIEEAASRLERVIALQPSNVNAVKLLADCHLRMGAYEKVVALLTPLEGKSGDDRLLAYLLGTALLRNGQTERAQVYIDRIFREGETAEAHLMLGTAHLMLQEFKEATRELARAAELAPQLPTVHALYGMALLRSGDAERAAVAFRQELAVNPHDFEANYYTGVILNQERRYDEAFTYLRRALTLRPRDVNAKFALANVYLATDMVAEGRRLLEEIVQDAPAFLEAHVQLARVYYRLGRREEAGRERALVEKLNAERQKREDEKNARELNPKNEAKGETP